MSFVSPYVGYTPKGLSLSLFYLFFCLLDSKAFAGAWSDDDECDGDDRRDGSFEVAVGVMGTPPYFGVFFIF